MMDALLATVFKINDPNLLANMAQDDYTTMLQWANLYRHNALDALRAVELEFWLQARVRGVLFEPAACRIHEDISLCSDEWCRMVYSSSMSQSFTASTGKRKRSADVPIQEPKMKAFDDGVGDDRRSCVDAKTNGTDDLIQPANGPTTTSVRRTPRHEPRFCSRSACHIPTSCAWIPLTVCLGSVPLVLAAGIEQQ